MRGQLFHSLAGGKIVERLLLLRLEPRLLGRQVDVLTDHGSLSVIMKELF